MKDICIIGGGLGPHYNEAMANQIKVLSEKINAPVLTCNDLGWKPFLSYGRYFIINSKFLMRRTPVLSTLNGAFLLLAVKLYERRYKTILLSGGIEGEFIGHLPPEKCIPIITSIDPDNAKLQDKMRKYGPMVKKIIAQSKKVRKILLDAGVKEERIDILYPIIDPERSQYSEPHFLEEFRILFASSPNMEMPGEDNFTDKGVPLLLESFKEFTKGNNARLYIVWRGKYTKQLYDDIRRLNLVDLVDIVEGITDMLSMYSNTHITVLPFSNLKRSPEIPSSGVESILCGRPVVSTDVCELSSIIKEYDCGCVSRPEKEEFVKSLEKCKNDYHKYQINCILAAKHMNACSEIQLKSIKT